MKEMTIETKVKVCTVDELSPADREVVDAARRATANSYAVYSHFNVGAAVRLADDTIVAGTNQENAAYPSGLCAERTTIFWANSQYPSQAVKVLAIAARTDQGELEVPIPPCGDVEIDILESGECQRKGVNHAIHWGGYGENLRSVSKCFYEGDWYEGFHTYALEWTEEEYVFYIDGKETWRTAEVEICEVPAYLKLTAEFGTWAGTAIPDELPDCALVDWVHVYKEVK